MPRPYNSPSKDVEVKLEGPDTRYEYWEGAPFGVDFRILRWAEIIDPDTEEGEEKLALQSITGGDDFRLARADPETERRFKVGTERASAALTIEKATEDRLIRIDMLRDEYNRLAERFPEERYSFEQKLMELDDTEAISTENAEKNYDDLLTLLNADFFAKLQASADEANRNFRVYEKKTAEFTFKTTEEKIQDFLKDEL